MYRFKKDSCSIKEDKTLLSSSCLQCKACGTSSCTVVDNRLSFVLESKESRVCHLLYDTKPLTCMGKCKNSCLEALNLLQEVKRRSIQVED